MIELALDTFGDITLDADGRPVPQAQVIRDLVEQAVCAEDAGVDFFGVGEHHRPDFAVSAPEVVLAVIAGRTRRMRLGSAVTVLGTDDPVRVYQRFATLQAASGGRAEVTVGRGAFTESFPLFGHDTADYPTMFEDKLDLFMRLMRQGAVTWQGSGRPKLERQRVFPPLEGALQTWVAIGTTPESVVRAARYNLPILIAVIGGPAARFKPLADLYREAFTRLGRPARAVGVHSAGHIAETDAAAMEAYWPAYQLMRNRLGEERGWPPITRKSFEREVAEGSLYVGAPETVARKIVQTARTLDIARFQMRYSVGTLPHEALLRSIALYGTRVAPLVREMLG